MNDISASNPTLLLSNDDGIKSPGLYHLYRALRPLGEIVVVAPDKQRSADGKSITFHKPLRSKQVQLEDHGIGYTISGTPADAVIFGKHILQGKKPSLAVSGINKGENTSIHSLLTSGTCAVAMEASMIFKIPSIAFSLEVEPSHFFTDDDEDSSVLLSDFKNAAKASKKITEGVLKKGLPEGVAFLNVNFPKGIQDATPMKLTSLALEKYSNFIIVQKDPQEREILWIWGDLFTEFPEETDSHAVLKQKVTSITPISMDFRLPDPEAYNAIESLLEII